MKTVAMQKLETLVFVRSSLIGSRLRLKPMIFACTALLLGLVAVGHSFAAGKLQDSSRQQVSFNRDVRPILAENCFFCHGPDENLREADLRLDDRQSSIDAGAVMAGEPDQSELIARIFTDDSDLQMPPVNSNRKLTEGQKAILREWISEGAEYEEHWAFQPPVNYKVPLDPDDDWSLNPIDRFVWGKLKDIGLKPSPEADRHVLIKRLYADLIGLPPTPEEIEQFVFDRRPDAYDQLVDRLLNHPHYGERMALPWLDAARYADSNGFQQDGDHWQWIWRDWVVRAFNDDLPFDQFTIWQLAGDLLDEPTLDQKIASAFNRNHMLNGEGGAIAEEQRFVGLFDRVDTTSTNWLGLTVACAQCHDHKYDPISQKEYYQFLDAFNRVPEQGVPKFFSSRIRVDPPFLELPTEENNAVIADLEAQIEAVRSENPDDPGADKQLLARLDEYRKDQIPRLMIMGDDRPRPTHILDRGEYLAPLEQVDFDTPAFLPRLPADFPRNRLGFAQWLFLPEHPLTARVQVNRLWQHFFGAGLVTTSEDFGVQSEYPIHLELLDWLAIEFRQQGWSLKAIQRLIVTSATYRQSSQFASEHKELDPLNRYYARASRFRMPSMILRDWALAASGLLNPAIGGPPVYPYQPDRVWEPLAITKERDFTYPQSQGDDLYRRSLYTFWRRTIAPANLFDSASRQTCRVRTSVTSSPLHALTMLNDPTWVEAARTLAANSMSKDADLESQIKDAFARVVCRDPSPTELSILQDNYVQQLSIYHDDETLADKLLSVGNSDPSPELFSERKNELAALTTVCLLIFNLDEALTRQ